MIYVVPKLTDIQKRLMSAIDDVYELKPTKKGYSLYIDGVYQQSLSIALRSLIKRKIVNVVDGVICVNEKSWREKCIHERIQMDDIINVGGIWYRVYKETKYSVYAYKDGYEDAILSVWISKNKQEDLRSVHSKHDYGSGRLLVNNRVRYQKNMYRRTKW